MRLSRGTRHPLTSSISIHVVRLRYGTGRARRIQAHRLQMRVVLIGSAAEFYPLDASFNRWHRWHRCHVAVSLGLKCLDNKSESCIGNGVEFSFPLTV